MTFTSKEKKEKNSIEELGAELNRVSDGLKEKLDSLGAEELKAFLGQVSLDESENQKQKKEDQDLAEKKEAAKAAGLKYKDISKANKTKSEYVAYLLDGMGVKGLSEPSTND